MFQRTLSQSILPRPRVPLAPVIVLLQGALMVPVKFDCVLVLLSITLWGT